MRTSEIIFFEGVVEDRNDPLMLGRLRVRIFGEHTSDKSKLPTENLPWALPLQPITSAANSGVGTSPTGPVEGTVVFGYFRDGKDKQQFVVVGTVAGIPEEKGTGERGFEDPNGNYPREAGVSDVNPLARGETNKIITDHNGALVREVPIAGGFGTWSEPAISFDSKYPFDHVRESESGHFEEWDDTPKNERLHRRHRTGTGYEIMHDGTKAERIVKDNYEVVLGSDNIYVKGNVNITTSENANIYAAKSINIDAQEDVNIKAGSNIVLQAGGEITEFADGDVKIASGGATKIQAGSTFLAFASGRADMKGSTAHLNSAAAQSPGITKPLEDVPSSNVQDQITAQSEAFLISIEGNGAPIDAELLSDTPVSQDIFSVGEQVSIPSDTGEPQTSVITSVDNTPPPKPKPVVSGTCSDIGTTPIDYNMQLTPRFKLKHLTHDCTFKHWIPAEGWLGLSAQEIICNLRGLAEHVLEPLADQYPGFRINCAFRKQTGNSQHRLGMACDLQWPSKTVGFEFEVAQWVKNNLPYDQMIFEHGNSAWLHLSYNRDGARAGASRVLSYKPEGWGNGKQYTTGLVLAYSKDVRVSPGGTTFG